MIMPKQDKMKRLLLFQLDTQIQEEEDQKSLQKWIQKIQVIVDRILV